MISNSSGIINSFKSSSELNRNHLNKVRAQANRIEGNYKKMKISTEVERDDTAQALKTHWLACYYAL